MEPRGSGSSGDREPLAGLVERVTFHKADSGFCVLHLKASGKRDLVTVLGAAPSIAAGEYIQASGRWENHSERGWSQALNFRVLGCLPDAIQDEEEAWQHRHAAEQRN